MFELVDLEELSARADAATDGPWHWYDASTGQDFDLRIEQTGRGYHILAENREDADFIAHARTDIPSLIAEIKMLNDVIVKARNLTRKTNADEAYQLLCDTTLLPEIRRAVVPLTTEEKK